jgi:hypothetical protein
VATIFFTLARYEAEASPVLGAMARSSEATTLAEVKVEPSSKVTPLRSWKVISLLPSL